MDENNETKTIPVTLLAQALQDLRRVRGSSRLTRQALVQYFQAGIKMELELNQLVHWFFFWPNQRESTFGQAGYSPKESLEVFEMVKRIPIQEIIVKNETDAA